MLTSAEALASDHFPTCTRPYSPRCARIAVHNGRESAVPRPTIKHHSAAVELDAGDGAPRST
jgi:hypothetical protein